MKDVEDKGNKGPSSLFVETLDLIQAERQRLRKPNKKPSTAEIVKAAWAIYEHFKDLPAYDRALALEVIEMIKDPNGSYRTTVADTVQAWRTISLKKDERSEDQTKQSSRREKGRGGS